MKKINVAAFGQGVSQRDISVPGAVADVDRAPLLVRPVEVSAAIKRCDWIEAGGFQQRGSGDRFKDRSRRQRHLDRAMEERAGWIGKQRLAVCQIVTGKYCRIESRRAGQ